MIIKNNLIIDENLNNYQTMMKWEKPYMEECVKVLKPHGDVLEIGFGMGYSATAINKYPIRSYTVLEKDEEVIKKFNKWRLKQKNKKIKLIKGLWQYTVPSLNKKYDCIFFDDSPSHELNRNNNDRFNLFLKLILNKNVKYNSKLVCYAIGRSIFTGYLTKHFTQEYYKYNIKVPYFCKYAKGDFMGVSKIIFKKQN
jgi:hypothetical protein|tara:strand:- start:127 stop:717 length:591 start_codon:yes stop_codon:yes gene_type:complete